MKRAIQRKEPYTTLELEPRSKLDRAARRVPASLLAAAQFTLLAARPIPVGDAPAFGSPR